MTEETKTEEKKEDIILSEEQKKIVALAKVIESYQFLGNTLEFNAIIYSGIRIILQNLSRIEDKLNELDKKIKEDNGNK